MRKEVKIVCTSCRGTGLYQGMCEKDDCAVVCCRCDGTGGVDFSYDEFKQRFTKPSIKRVFKTSCGYNHSSKDITTKEGKFIAFSNGGCTYEEWLNGADPKPVKELYCPYLWTGQGLQSKDKNNLYKKCCKEALGLGGWISDCEYFCEKDKCWEIYDED